MDLSVLSNTVALSSDLEKAMNRIQKGYEAKLEKAMDDRLGYLQQSQSRIEGQLQDILASQKRQEASIMSKSLDASSPEGCQTWMMVGGLLKEEGITPSMIKWHGKDLINAIKKTIKELSSSSITTDSYLTAVEYPYNISNNAMESIAYDPKLSRPHEDSLSILSSGPPRGSYFHSYSVTDPKT